MRSKDHNETLKAGDCLLKVEQLEVAFRTDEGRIIAIDGIDFEVKKGQVVGIVGESGSGKSVTTRAIMRLLPKNAVLGEQSRINFHKSNGSTIDIASLKANSNEVRNIRGGEISMIFQEPMASFSPVWTIGNQMIEAIHLHRKMDKKEARETAIEMLDKVGISNPELRVDQYSHELSGGMRQRAMIAMALSTNPSLLIADEPTTALDVTIQAQILELIAELQSQLQMSVIFITHDMGVIAHVADEVAVMYLGMIVERGPTAGVIHDPKHPYTEGLLSALPDLNKTTERLKPVGGDIPSPLQRPSGCPFHTRCSRIIHGLCDQKAPPELALGKNRLVRCFLYQGEESQP